MNNRKMTIIGAVAAVVFALIGCLGDSNQTVFGIGMGLSFASLGVFIIGMIRSEFSAKVREEERVSAKEKTYLKETA